MVLAGELLERWGDLSCFVHTLQLAVSAGLALNGIARPTVASCKIVSHFKHSTVAMSALIERQKLLKVPEHSLSRMLLQGGIPLTLCTSGWQSREWPSVQ